MSTPRWQTAIEAALRVPENKTKIVYQVASIDSQNIPHVRSHVHRGFLVPASASELPLFVSSSDVRAPKIAQLLEHPTVELCWWMEGSNDQFRVQAKALVVTPPDRALAGVPLRLPSVHALDEAGEARADGEMFQGADGRYDWERRRREVFDAMDPALKASWCAPRTSGTPMPSYDVPTTENWPTELPTFLELSTDEDKKNYELALTNFAMIVFEPTKIDWCQLGDVPNRRTLFTRKDYAGGFKWEEQVLAP